MKTVLFVPGFQEDEQTRDYASLLEAIRARGYHVRFVPIHWKRTTVQDWVTELEAVYRTYDASTTILAGFSYGSMTAFMAATKRNPAELWLFSLSPYFAEDHTSKNMKAAWLRQIGKRRVEQFSRLDFGALSTLVTCRTLLFAGQQEVDTWPVIGERSADAHRLLKHNKLIIVPGVGHDVAHPGYIRAIVANI